MRVRTAKDVEKLDQKIQDELGIDVKKYRNEEVAATFGELMVFPQYIANWTFRPLFLTLAVFLLGFFVLDLVHIEYLLYAVIGLVLFLVFGVFVALLFLTWKMKQDIWSIADFSLDIMRQAVDDLGQVKDQIKPENRKDVLALLFKGILHLVTIPMITKALSDRIPFLGGIVAGFIKRILTVLSDRLKFDEKNLTSELNKGADEEDAVGVFQRLIKGASIGLEKIVDFTFGVARFPLKVLFAISGSILALFVYLIGF